MKNKKQVIKENINYTRLINAVIKRIGIDSVNDVNNHGIDSGFGGFIYYSDTHDFTLTYKKEILLMLEEMADSLGEDIVFMVSNFGVFRKSPMDSEDKKDLYLFLAGKNPKQGALTNVLAWFAAEEVCRMFEN